MACQSDGTAITGEDIIVSYVLGDFALQEEDVIKPAIGRLAEAIECIITEGITAALNRFN